MRPLIELLNGSDLSFAGGIADYTSLRWENKTDSCGSFEIHVPVALPYVTDGIIVHLCRDIPEPFGVVTSVTLSKKGTVINGSMISRMLDWRYPQRDGYSARYSTSQGIGHALCLCAQSGLLAEDDNNGFFGASPVFSYTKEGQTVSIEADMQTSCLELMTSIARDGQYCFGCTVEGGQFKLFTYPYKETGMVLDSKDGCIYDLTYTLSGDSERNVFGYSLGNEEEGYIHRLSSGSASYSGVERKMLNLGKFSSAPSSIIREKRALLTKNRSIEAKLRLAYPKNISLGDIVTIKSSQWGIEEKLTVSAVSEVWEDKYSCNITFGNPQETAYRKLLRIYR